MQGRQGRWASIKARCSSFFSETINAGSAFGGVIKQVWQSEALRSNMQTFSLQAWTGISFGSFFSFTPTSVQYEKTRAPLLGQMSGGITSFSGFIPDNTLLLALQVMLTEQLSHGLHAIPGVKGTYWELGAYSVDALAYLYLLRNGWNRKINNIFSQMAVAKAATPDAKILEKQSHQHRMFKPCDGEKCGKTASTMADVMKIPESIADTLFCYSIANACSLLFFSLKNPLPYINEMVLYPLLSLKYGRDFLNAKLSSVSMCEKHRNEIITANNARCMAKGATLLFGVYGIPAIAGWALEKYGYTWAAALINNEFISNGLFAFGHMNFMTAELQITNTLPGAEPGIDIFKYVHITTQESTKWLVSKLISVYWDPTSDLTWSGQLAKLEEAYKAPVVQFAMTVCVGKDALSLRAFLKRPAVHSFITTHEPSLKENVEWLNDLRYTGIARTILKILPERVLDPSTKNFLDAWGSKAMDGPAESMNRLIEKIYPGVFPYIPPKDEISSLARAESASKAREEKEVMITLVGPLDRAEQVEKKLEERRSKPSQTPSLAQTVMPALKMIGILPTRPAPLEQLSADARSFLAGKKND
jgi:hypothetical protein